MPPDNLPQRPHLPVAPSGATLFEAGEFHIGNAASTGFAVYATSVGTADLMRGYHSGTSGNAADLDIADVGNSSAVVDARTTGAGPAHYGETAGPYAVEVYSDYESFDTHVVHAEYTVTGNHDAVAVYGYSVPADQFGYGGYFEGGYRGVYGKVIPTGIGGYYGVRGYVSGGSGTNYAVSGYVVGGATNWAGYFSGNVSVIGTLSKGGGAFKIDHPLDPANKYLYHSFVESPDMMNVYNGNVVLDSSGEAWVELPEWFDALNRDFRYQLTAIGAPGPNLYVADEISGNRFKVAGGDPGLKISWQVTGIRQDRFAEENRIPVEEVKSDRERGRYMHPEAYGLPRTMSVDYDEREEQQLADETASTRKPRSATEEVEPDDD